jgi:plasmid stabilization system protein ParE
MAFDIEITDPARDDIDDAVTFIAQNSQAAARKWKVSLQALLLSLQDMPGRFAIIAEAGELVLPYRSAPHHSHRVIHGARRPLSHQDIDPQDEI